MKGVSTGDFVTNGNVNNYNLLLLLDKDKSSVISYLNKILLDKQIVKNYKDYLYLQFKKWNSNSLVFSYK